MQKSGCRKFDSYMIRTKMYCETIKAVTSTFFGKSFSLVEVTLPRRHFVNYETRKQPLLSRLAFARRMAGYFGASFLLVGVSLLGGMFGYHYLESMEWIDAFANAAMILSGMGPLEPVKTWNGKLFAGLYALYSGLILILVAGLILAPVVHRILHRFHLE